jgi:hypothetical protein
VYLVYELMRENLLQYMGARGAIPIADTQRILCGRGAPGIRG